MQSDFEFIYQTAQPIFSELSHKRLFVTGGTGFFGKWILGAIHHANTKYGCDIQIDALTRNHQPLINLFPEYKNSLIQFIDGDIRHFQYTKVDYDYLIHGATSTSVKLNHDDPKEMLSTIVDGTNHFLSFASETNAQRVLFMSSGAVYGKQDSNVVHQPEVQSFKINESSESAYTLGKFKAENLVRKFSEQTGKVTTIARCYAFNGPYLPLDAHFAIGNFMSACMKNEDIHIQGDGTPQRSYLYAADLVIWLLTILVRGENKKAYNVGSEQNYSIREIAERVKSVWLEEEFITFRRKTPEIIIHQKVDTSKPTLRYVPQTFLAKNELHLKQCISLEDGLRKTFRFNILCP